MTNRTKLIQDIQHYSQHNGDELMAAMDSIINNAEESIYREVPMLECYKKWHNITFSFAAHNYAQEGIGFPVGVNVVNSITYSHQGEFRTLKQRQVDYLEELYRDTILAEPNTHPEYYFTRDNRINLIPYSVITGARIDIEGHGRLRPLAENDETNWITENAYRCLLAASMIEVSLILKNAPEWIQPWQAIFQEEIGKLRGENASTMSSVSGGRF